MNISSIQKTKLLNNLYLSFYADGKRPNENEIRSIFNRYFNKHRMGAPIPIGYQNLFDSSVVDYDLLNELMANTGLNLEVLYDFLSFGGENVISLVTSLNTKLDSLRLKRSQLESKVDDLLFAVNNSDGFFFSVTENFASFEKVDLNLTNAFVDLDYNHVTLPILINENQDAAVGLASMGDPSFSITSADGSIDVEIGREEFDLILDGLTDTYWSYRYRSSKSGIISFDMTIPISTRAPITQVSAVLYGSRPSAVVLRAIPLEDGLEPVVRVLNTPKDYDRFSFSLDDIQYSRIDIQVVKVQPDLVVPGPSDNYIYDFGFRELHIGSSYFESNASVISQPISLPSQDNAGLSIDAVSIDVNSQQPSSTAIRYFVAADTISQEDAVTEGFSDAGLSSKSFNWIPITPKRLNGVPLSDEGASYSNVVNFRSQNYKKLRISSSGQGASLDLLPLNNPLFDVDNPDLLIPDGLTMNSLNPTNLIYKNRYVYRICRLPVDEEFVEPVLLSARNAYHRFFTYFSEPFGFETAYTDLEGWREAIQLRRYVSQDILYNQSASVTPATRPASSGFMSSKLFMSNAATVSHTIVKSRPDFNLAMFVNGALVADLPKGTNSREVTTTFVSGINNIVFTYEKDFVGDIVFTPVNNGSLANFGDIFLETFEYLNPIQFRNQLDTNKKCFTITEYMGSKEVVANQYVGENSQINYYSNQTIPVTAVRFRADLMRFEDPFVTPFLDSVRVMFKHRDRGDI